MKSTPYLFRAICLLAAPMLAAACSDDIPTPQPVEVSFTTEVHTRANVINTLDEATQLSVFYTLRSPESSTTSTLQTTFSREGTTWKASQGLYLKFQESLSLQACYPAVSNATPNSVPVSLAQQQDVLYSGSAVSLTHDKPTAHLTMNHALCIFSFNLMRAEQASATEIRSISLLSIPSQGSLDLSTGEIVTSHTGDFTLNVSKTLDTQGWKSDLPGMFVLPCTPTKAQLSIQTDKGKFSCRIPDDTYAGGNQYIFHLAVSDNGLTLFKEQTQVVSLNQRDDQLSAEGYGVLRLGVKPTDNSFTIPTFTAPSTLSGLILWGDNSQQEFSAGASHIYGSNDPVSVTIETWGAESVTLPNLTGIQSIDLTDF